MAPVHGARSSPGWVCGTTRGYAPACSPVDYIERHGLLNDQLVAVHCVQLTDADLRKARRGGGDGRHLPAQQSLDRRRSAASRSASMRPASEWRSAPTASQVWRTSTCSRSCALMRQLAPAIPGPRAARKRHESTAPKPSDSGGARNDRAGRSAAELIAVACRDQRSMWKNTY